MDLNKLLEKVKNSTEYDSSYYLTHFFVMFDQNLKQIDDWQVGFYSKEKDVVKAISVGDESGEIVSKESEALKKKEHIIKELKLEEVKIDIDEVIKKVVQCLRNNYIREIPIKAFVVLQVLDEYPIWNFTFITSAFKTLNIKVDAVDGEIVHHGVIQIYEHV